MRKTIELPDDQRARLLSLAAMRGEKGFSRLISEAIELYLRNPPKRDPVTRALALKGVLSEEEASALSTSVQELRAHWR